MCAGHTPLRTRSYNTIHLVTPDKALRERYATLTAEVKKCIYVLPKRDKSVFVAVYQ